MCVCHYHLHLPPFAPMPFMAFQCRPLLLCILGRVCLLWRGGVWDFGLTLPSFILPWIGYCLGKSIYPYSPLGFHFCHCSSSHGHVGCVDPLGLLPLSLGFLGLFTLSLAFTPSMNLVANILAMLAHWTCYLFSKASSAYLLYLYL